MKAKLYNGPKDGVEAELQAPKDGFFPVIAFEPSDDDVATAWSYAFTRFEEGAARYEFIVGEEFSVPAPWSFGE